MSLRSTFSLQSPLLTLLTPQQHRRGSWSQEPCRFRPRAHGGGPRSRRDGARFTHPQHPLGQDEGDYGPRREGLFCLLFFSLLRNQAHPLPHRSPSTPPPPAPPTSNAPSSLPSPPPRPPSSKSGSPPNLATWTLSSAATALPNLPSVAARLGEKKSDMRTCGRASGSRRVRVC